MDKKHQFFGRENELKRIHNAWQKAMQGEVQVVLIGGEPTIGKTALCNAFYNQLSQKYDSNDYWPDYIPDTKLKSVSFVKEHPKEVQEKWQNVVPNYLWLSTSCVPRQPNQKSYEGSRLLPWMDIPKGLEGKRCVSPSSDIWKDMKEIGIDAVFEVAGMATGVSFLKTLVYDIPRKLWGYRQKGQIDFEEAEQWTDAQRQQAEEKLLKIMLEIANPQNGLPTVIFIDDLQWADDDSCRLLTRLASTTTNAKMLILGTYRTIDLETDTWKHEGNTCRPPFYVTLDELKRNGDRIALTTIDNLGPVDQKAVINLIKAQYNDTPHPDLVNGLAEIMNGQPFFTIQYCLLLIAEELVTRDGQFEPDINWQIIYQKMSDHQLPMPNHVEAVLHRRIERLEDNLKNILSYGSIMGIRFTGGFILAVFEELNQTLTKLQLIDIFRPLIKDHRLLNEITSEDELQDIIEEFAHLMIQQISYARLDQNSKQNLIKIAGEYAFNQLRTPDIRDQLSFVETELLIDTLAQSLKKSKIQAFLKTTDDIYALGAIADGMESYGTIETNRLFHETIKTFLENRVKDDPSLQRDLSVSYNKLGDVLVGQGDLAGARRYYEECVQIFKDLVSGDASNRSLQRDLSVSYYRLGDLAERSKEQEQAQKYYEQCLVIREELARLDPTSAQAQEDVAFGLIKCNRVEDALGILLKLHEEGRLVHSGLRGLVEYYLTGQG